jgi:hypothetical protein
MQPAAEGRGPKARDSNRMKQLEPGIAKLKPKREDQVLTRRKSATEKRPRRLNKNEAQKNGQTKN